MHARPTPSPPHRAPPAAGRTPARRMPAPGPSSTWRRRQRVGKTPCNVSPRAGPGAAVNPTQRVHCLDKRGNRDDRGNGATAE